MASSTDKDIQHRRCPRDTSAVFLYRKVLPQPPKAILLKAPDFEASNEVMDAWLKSYLDALDEADPEHEDGEPGTLSTNSCHCNIEAFAAAQLNVIAAAWKGPAACYLPSAWSHQA